jgi:hypothetical protein
MPYRSRVTGAPAVRKLLRALPDAAKEGLLTEFYRAGPQLLGRVLGRTPRKTGALARGLSFKVYPRSVRLLVGLIGTKKERSKLFYAKIQEFGRKASVKTVTRAGTYGRALHAGLKVRPGAYKDAALKAGVQGAYQMRVRAMPGKRFITGRMPDLRRLLGANLRGLWSKALSRVKASGGE